MTRPVDPRAHELLAERALYGLDDAHADELRELGADGDDTYDLAAAAVELATLAIEPMPAMLADRITGRIPGAPAPNPSAAGTAPSPRPATALPRRHRPEVWFVTATSVLVIVGVSWWLLRRAPAPAAAAATAAAARAELLASAADLTRLDWQPTKEAATASGDVVWSASAQRGFMRFVGLRPNDAETSQYQLWIFDRQRDQAFPVDGGVFDVTSTGEVIVPITAKLHVDDATLFAVTIERAGGVVVSKRDRIVVTAARR